ncbi:hypothetical protein [Xanthomonas perforans]|uniref:hypothetical protein n=1 Tax=Xanthomonas perforans TaxID=442694 RepID=UPI000AF5164D|nr:hypothetical protein [Xanthomonas perforans]NJC32405.1 hypothetical protein [Xanthomonas arboricola]MBZ2498458.1 hypothetical protein [Xanthomonas perforans]MBZ2510545.1 hypothetical protein [Xanthomonas perforans]MBZ2514818.1 hypothetical protein [Xanthomonas perforans]MBZ2565878.1 hypothetical protein [Xanthomonas perforans]
MAKESVAVRKSKLKECRKIRCPLGEGTSRMYSSTGDVPPAEFAIQFAFPSKA